MTDNGDYFSKVYDFLGTSLHSPSNDHRSFNTTALAELNLCLNDLYSNTVCCNDVLLN